MRGDKCAGVFLVLVAMSGCYTVGDGLNDDLDVNTDGRVIGSVNGIVRDDITQVPLSGVTVSWARFNQILSTTTDANGVFTLTGLSQGDYDLVFRASGDDGAAVSYADAKMRFEIPSLEDIGIVDQPTDEPFEHTVDAIVPMYPLTAGIDSLVIATMESPGFGDPETGILASGAAILIDVLPNTADYWIISDQVALTTEADGSFSATGLPATPLASLTVLPFESGGYHYATQNLVVGLNPSGQTILEDIYVYNAASPPVIVADDFIDVDDVLVSSNLTVSFSKLFDEASVDLELTGSQGQADISWAWLGAELTVTPDRDFQASDSYVLVFSGTTVDGYDYQNSFTFETEEGIALLSSNLLDSSGSPVEDYDITAELSLGFTRDVDSASADTYFSLTEAGYLVYSTATVTGADALIAPMFDLEPDTEYELSYSVSSDLLDDVLADTIAFRTETAASLPGTVSGFELVSPQDMDYDTVAYTVRWDSVPGAEEYHIYARDTLQNTSEVLIDIVSHQDYWTYHGTTLSLPSQFDVFQSDGLQTPLASGTEVVLNIAAANGLGEGSLLAPSKEVDLEDNVRPEVVSYNVIGSTDNTGGTAPIEVVLKFTASEYIESIQAQYSPVSCFSCSVLSSERNISGNGGEITIAIGVGDELIDDEVIIAFDDTSGNSAIADTYVF